jgi:hypothetical protein
MDDVIPGNPASSDLDRVVAASTPLYLYYLRYLEDARQTMLHLELPAERQDPFLDLCKRMARPEFFLACLSSMRDTPSKRWQFEQILREGFRPELTAQKGGVGEHRLRSV